jgi:hypothetical protein
VPLKVAAAISSALILPSSPIPFQVTEVDKIALFTDTVISCSVSLPATSVAFFAFLGINFSKKSLQTYANFMYNDFL